MSVRTARRVASDADDGSVSVFALGWIVVALMAVAVLVGASQVHLDRMRLVSLADELASAAAAEAAREAYTTGADQLDRAHAEAAVAAALADGSREWRDEVVVTAVGTEPDGTVTVALARHTVPLEGGWSWLPEAAGVTVTAQGSARVG
ncbi:pilus assembly protein TadG-related protein [Demequina activiva]|uniref:Putative Flp pilus-assembly TadG-like N-terminal domain-containing protein n=1 Tax=Demequina activiva TaxID=1582364 RepID=A0A919Q1F5_9MICO|nr:pilus assembly protein TadG-related protein [Demequina activiva]GIG53507.1 hypothetical protein Dac01nite_02590 [Demequina activiva]